MQALWRLLIQHVPPHTLQDTASPSVVANLFDLAATMPGEAIQQGKIFKAAAPGQVAGGATGWASFKSMEGADGATRRRFNTAEALGVLGCYWPAGVSLHCTHGK